MVSCLPGDEKVQKIFLKKMYHNGAKVEIIAEISMPCPSGNRDMFREARAFLCHFENLPFKSDGVLSRISGFAVVDDPWTKLRDWSEDPLEFIEFEWNERDLLHSTREEAIADKIQDLETLWQSSLRNLCAYCQARSEQCRKRLESLKSPLPFFSSSQLALSLSKCCGLEKALNHRGLRVKKQLFENKIIL